MPLHTRSRFTAWLAIVVLLYDALTRVSAQSQTSIFLPIEPMTQVDTTAGTGYFSDPYPIYVAEPWTSASIPRAFSGTTKDLLLCWHGLQPGCYAETPITIDPGPLAEQARQQGAVSSTFQNNNIFRGRDGIWQMVSTLNLRTAGAKSDATHWTVIVHAHPTAVSYSIPTAWVADTVLVGSLGQPAPANYDGKFFEDKGTLYLLYSSRLSDNPAHDGVVAQTMQSAMRPASSPPVTMLQPEVINGGFNAELFHPTDSSDEFKLVETGNVTMIAGKYVMAYSTGAFDRSNYKAGVAWSDTFLPGAGNTYRKVVELDSAGVWGQPGHFEPLYLLQSQKPNWPNDVAAEVVAPGVPSIVADRDGGWILYFAGFAPSDAIADPTTGNFNAALRRPYFLRLRVDVPRDATVAATSNEDLARWILP